MSNVIDINKYRPFEDCIERVEQLCREAADKVQDACDVLRTAGYEPSRIGIEPCGMDTEVDLEGMAGDLAEVAGYLSASGNLYPLDTA